MLAVVGAPTLAYRLDPEGAANMEDSAAEGATGAGATTTGAGAGVDTPTTAGAGAGAEQTHGGQVGALRALT